MKVGDMIWQQRAPGGECLLVAIYESYEEYKEIPNAQLNELGNPFWTESDFPVLKILHPLEGLIEDPSYYYVSIGKKVFDWNLNA
jgi:hypothetical protein